MLQLYDKNKKKIAALTEYENLCIESILESGDKTLSFYYSLFYKFYDEIEEETYIRTKTDEYVVKAKGGDSNDNKTLFTCKLNVEELEGTIFDRFESVEQNLVDALNLAIVGTGWRLNSDNCNNRKKRTIRMTNCSSWTIIQKAKKLYDIEFKFDTLNKIIMLFDKIGDDRGIYFIDSLNLRALQVQGNSYGFYTRIIPTGKDGLTIASVNGGKTYLENKQYSNKTLTYYWKDERYTKPESLKEDALEKLNIMSKPFKSYIASTINLAKMNGKYKDILDYNLGDYIYLISKKNKVKDKHRIVKTKEYPQDHSKDTVELANKALDLSEEKLLVDEMSNTLENITTDNGTINGSTIDSIQVKQIEDFKANVIQVTNLHALNANIDYLKVNKADMQDVNIVKAKIGTLETTKANITELNSLKATLQQAIITKADITDLNAAVGKIHVLESKTASIENALAGNLTADNFKTNAITAGSAVIAEGAIGSSQISSLSVNKLEAGDITTSKHRIVSADGTIEIVGNQILINRNNVNRVILGEYRKSDGTTEYGLLVRAKDGQTIMLDGNGVHNAGITDGAIDNNKVADNANISGNKLDINSVIREVNTHGTETIKGTKVQIGDRTLDVELSTQKNTITEHSKELSSQKASLTALDNALKFKVDSQTFTQSTQTINNNINRAKEEAIKVAENLALEKSNLAKKYAEDVATAKANLAQANAIANADCKITEEERKRIQQAQENLNTAISKADKAKQDAILEANRVAELKKQEAISSANSHADSKANEALNNAKSFVNAEITTVNTHLNKATAEINVLKEKIESKVSQVDIDKSINKVVIGGRNLVINREDFKFTSSSYGGTDISKKGIIEINNPSRRFHVVGYLQRYLSEKLDNSKPYCISLDLKANGESKNLYLSFFYRGANSPSYAEGVRVSDINNVWRRFTIKMHPNENSNTDVLELVFNSMSRDCGVTRIEYRNLKIEEGTIPTADSEAPEDSKNLIVDSIKVVTDKISTVESNLTQKTNSIEAGVRDLNSTTQSITTNVSNINRDLTSKINSNLDVAKNFATSKAIEALNSAKSYTNAEITTVNSKVHNVESNLNILSDKINTKVSQSDVEKSISAIQVGGRNYLTNSMINKTNSDYLIAQLYFGKEKPKEGEEFTISIKGELGQGKRLFGVYNSGGNVSLVSLDKRDSNGIYRGTFNWIVADTNNTHINIYTIDSSTVVDSTIEWVKLEKGNKVSSSWTPAPEDTDKAIADNIKVVDTKISDVSSSVTQLRDSVTTDIRAINSKTHSIETNLVGKASKQEVTEVNNRVATIKASLDGITQRVSATESKTQTLESDLNGKASKQEVNNVSSKVVSLEANLSGITNRVSSTESRINTLNGQVQNAITKQEFTEFKQSSKDAILDIQSTSPKNYVSNPIFNTGDLTNWQIWGGGTSWAVKEDTSLSHAYSLKLQCFTRSQGVTQTIPGLVYGKKYTLKVKMKVEQGTPGIMIRNDNQWGGVSFNTNQGYGKWVEVKMQFWAREGTTPIYIGNVSTDSISTFWVSEIMLHEGYGEIPFSDNAKELYSANFKADLNGIKCTFEDNSYTKMGRDGFEWWKNGMKYPYYCLMTQGVINHLSFNSGNYYHRVYLPAEFRGKHFKVQTMIQGWNFESGHVSGTMASGYQDLDYVNGQFTIYFNSGADRKVNCNIAYVVIA